MAELLQLEYEYVEYEQVQQNETIPSESKKIIEEIESMGELGKKLLEEIEVADWEALNIRIQNLGEFPSTYSKIEDALKNKDFMALLSLSELWENSKKS